MQAAAERAASQQLSGNCGPQGIAQDFDLVMVALRTLGLPLYHRLHV